MALWIFKFYENIDIQTILVLGVKTCELLWVSYYIFCCNKTLKKEILSAARKSLRRSNKITSFFLQNAIQRSSISIEIS